MPQMKKNMHTETQLSAYDKNKLAQTFTHRQIPVAWMINSPLPIFHVEMRNQHHERCMQYLNYTENTQEIMTPEHTHSLLAMAMMCTLKADPEQLQALFDHPENAAYINVLYTGNIPLFLTLYGEIAPVQLIFYSEYTKKYSFHAHIEVCSINDSRSIYTAIQWGERALQNYLITHGTQHPHKVAIEQLISAIKNTLNIYKASSSTFTQLIAQLQLLLDCIQPDESNYDSLIVPGSTAIHPAYLSLSPLEKKQEAIIHHPSEQLAIYYRTHHSLPEAV